MSEKKGRLRMWAVNRRTFEAMFIKHVRLSGLMGVPEVGSEDWNLVITDWYEIMAMQGNPLLSQVEIAMMMARAEDHGFLNKQLKAIISHLRNIRSENIAQPDGKPRFTDVAKARADSESCVGCGGSGLLHLWHKDHPGKNGMVEIRIKGGRKRRIRTEATACCTCPYGRYLLKDRQKDADTRDNFLDGEKLGQSDWRLSDPTDSDIDDIPRSLDWKVYVEYWRNKTGKHIGEPIGSMDGFLRDANEAAGSP